MFYYTEKPPFQPTLSSVDDTSHFEEIDPEPEVKTSKSKSMGAAKFTGDELHFAGYTFNRAFNRFSLRSSDGTGAPDTPASAPETPVIPPLTRQQSMAANKATKDLERKVAEIQARLDNAEKDAAGW